MSDNKNKNRKYICFWRPNTVFNSSGIHVLTWKLTIICFEQKNKTEPSGIEITGAEGKITPSHNHPEASSSLFSTGLWLQLTELEVFVLFFQIEAHIFEVMGSSKLPSHTFCTHMHKTPGTMQLQFIIRHAGVIPSDRFLLFCWCWKSQGYLPCYLWGCTLDIADYTNLWEVMSSRVWWV